MRILLPISENGESSRLRAAYVRAVILVGMSLPMACGFDAPGEAADLTAQQQSVPLPLKAPFAGAVPSMWTGIYVGGHIGYIDAGSAWTSAPGIGVPAIAGSKDVYDNDGPVGPMFGGLQAGYNYVFPSQLMLGIETDVSFPNHVSGTQPLSPTPASQFSVEDKVEFFGTARARVGWASDNWLIYATGGLAFDRDLITRTQLAGTALAGTATPGDEDSQYVTRLGWTIGLGTEFKVAQNWSLKLEYLFMDFDSKSVSFPLGGDRYIPI